jgi:hypothetical protein
VTASIKLRFHERRVRIVPALDAAGCPFAGPGVDLSGADAERVLAAAEGLVAAFGEVEPGARLRSVAIDFTGRRAVATLMPGPADERPRVVKVGEGRLLERLLEAAAATADVAAPMVAAALARRAR